MRTYEQTHPWISFRLNLGRARYKTWLLLGEAQSKCEHIAGVPLLPEVAQYLHRVYLAKGVMATTAIEGNTLTEEEVQQRLEGNLKLPPSKEYLGQEVDNVIEACNLIGTRILSGQSSKLQTSEILEYNRLILRNLPLAEHVIPGAIRKDNVGVGRYKGAPPEDCEYLLLQLCEWLNDRFEAPPSDAIAFGILKAIIAHIYIAWIHPFGDGNGRTARLIEFQILLAVGVPTAAAQLLSNHYNETRTEYYRQLDQAHRSGGEVLPFIEYALQGYVDGLKKQIEVIRNQQWHVHWINYLHEKFKDKNNQTDIRRRRLAIDLSEKTSPIPPSKIRHVSPRIAEAYAHKTDVTVKRDLKVLEHMRLIEKTTEGVRVKREVILAFLPRTRQQMN